MAKKRLPPERNRKPISKSKTLAKPKPKPKPKSKPKAKAKARTKDSPKTIVKSNNKSRSRIPEIANGDASSEDTELAAVPTSSIESENDEGADCSEAEACGVEQRSLSEEEVEDEEEEKEDEGEDEDEEEMPKNYIRKGHKGDAKSKGKRKSRKGESKEKGENALYTFPMNRISRIVKSEDLDVRIMQEAVFVINKASIYMVIQQLKYDGVIGNKYTKSMMKNLLLPSMRPEKRNIFLVNLSDEKFLQLLCKEAYAQAFLNKRKQIAYDHLSSVVSKRKRLQFLSDIVPEKVKAEDALALAAESEK